MAAFDSMFSPVSESSNVQECEAMAFLLAAVIGTCTVSCSKQYSNPFSLCLSIDMSLLHSYICTTRHENGSLQNAYYNSQFSCK